MRRNIGVALAVPSPFAEEIDGWRQRFGDPAAELMGAHITLLPPTMLQDIDPVMVHLHEVGRRHQAFPIKLRGTSTFRPLSAVVYVRVAQGRDEIVTLESDVRSGPLRRSLRFEYQPHVTVAQDLPEEVLTQAQHQLADYEAEFTAEKITVFEQDRAGKWNPLADFPLLAAA